MAEQPNSNDVQNIGPPEPIPREHSNDYQQIFNEEAEDNEHDFDKFIENLDVNAPQASQKPHNKKNTNYNNNNNKNNNNNYNNNNNDNNNYNKPDNKGYNNKNNNNNNNNFSNMNNMNMNNNKNVSQNQIRYKWQWDAGSYWKDYRAEDSQTIESQYGSKEMLYVDIFNTLYQINLVDLNQINTKNRGKRTIRRVPIDHKDNSKQSNPNRSGSYGGNSNYGGHKSHGGHGGHGAHSGYKHNNNNNQSGGGYGGHNNKYNNNNNSNHGGGGGQHQNKYNNNNNHGGYTQHNNKYNNNNNNYGGGGDQHQNKYDNNNNNNNNKGGGYPGHGNKYGNNNDNNNNNNYGGYNNQNKHNNNNKNNNNKSSFRWQWLNDRGDQWRDYESQTSQYIESKFSLNNIKIFQCNIGKHEYFVNFADMTQANAYTAKKRKIRRIEPNSQQQQQQKQQQAPKQYTSYNQEHVHKTKVYNNQQQGPAIFDVDETDYINNNNNNNNKNNGNDQNTNDLQQNAPNSPNMTQPPCYPDDDSKNNMNLNQNNSNPSFQGAQSNNNNNNNPYNSNPYNDNDNNNNQSPPHHHIPYNNNNMNNNSNPNMAFSPHSNHSNYSNRSDSNNYNPNNNHHHNQNMGFSPNNSNNSNNALRGESYKWQWKDDNNNFIDYDTKCSNQMEILYQNRGKMYKYKAPHNGQIYVVKFNDLKQYNEKTKASRDVRRVPLSVQSAPNNTKHYSSGPAMKWQWHDGKHFVDYDKKTSIAIEKAYKNKKSVYHFKNDKTKTMYTITFSSMKQRNDETNSERDIRQVPISVKGAKPQKKQSQRTKHGWPDPKTWKGPKQTAKRKIFGKKIMTLYHITDPKSGDLIFNEHKMIRGSKGMFGGGIYFAETIKDAKYKAEHHGVLITAKVFVGKVHVVNDSTGGHFTFQQLQSMKCDSVHAPNGSGQGAPERVVYNFDQVCVIKKEPCHK